MAQRGIRIATPDVETALDEAELDALVDELTKIAISHLPRPDVLTLIGELQLCANDSDVTSGTCFGPSPHQRAILLRALDHLKNLGHWGALLDLRDQIISSGDAPWTSYTLAFDADRQHESFTSHSLGYEVGDRLVASRDHEYKVIGLDAHDDHELLVAPWRAARAPAV